MVTHEFKCKDDPEANNRVPQKGDTRYAFIFPLENGDELKVYAGRETLNKFADFIGRMMVDDLEEEDKKFDI